MAESRGGPTAADVKDARELLGLTQAQAAALVYLRAQQRWGEYESGARKMDPARWELFLLKSGIVLPSGVVKAGDPELIAALEAAAKRAREPLSTLLLEARDALREAPRSAE
jgi:transcriptional regulator with XRE-family HTH domain